MSRIFLQSYAAGKWLPPSGAVAELKSAVNGRVVAELGSDGLDFGSMAADVLRRELASAQCVVAILTPQSITSHWVMFELGATWSRAKQVIPLLGGDLKDTDIPGPLRGSAGGRLRDPSTFDQLLDQVSRALGWPIKNRTAALAHLRPLASG